MVWEAPGAIAPSTHGNAVVQAPPLESKVRPLGVGSSTMTLVALDGPVFVTTIVYTATFPGPRSCGPVLVTDTSASGVTWSVSVALLGVGSPNPGGFWALHRVDERARWRRPPPCPASRRVASRPSGDSRWPRSRRSRSAARSSPRPLATHVHVAPVSPAGRGSSFTGLR